MSAVIKNYNLTIAEPEDSHIKAPFIEYKPFSDGWVTNEEEIQSIIATIKWLLETGKRPIVAVFTAG